MFFRTAGSARKCCPLIPQARLAVDLEAPLCAATMTDPPGSPRRGHWGPRLYSAVGYIRKTPIANGSACGQRWYGCAMEHPAKLECRSPFAVVSSRRMRKKRASEGYVEASLYVGAEAPTP
jgi:hypothetical protein